MKVVFKDRFFCRAILAYWLSLAASVFCAAGGPWASWVPCAHAEAKPWWESDPVFLSKVAIRVKNLLPGPPSTNSIALDQDHRELLRLQKERSKNECDRAKDEIDFSLDVAFGPHYGPLTESEVKRLSGFFEHIATDAQYFARTAKSQWTRARPYKAFSDIRPCIELETSSSYPSGVAAISRTFADVLTEIFPGRKELFLSRANQIAEDRVLAGIHHPTDIEAGKTLGDAVFNALSKNPKFATELKKFEKELIRPIGL